MRRKTFLSFLMMSALFFYTNAEAKPDCDVVCKALKNVSSPYASKNLYDIYLAKKSVYEELRDEGYGQQEAIKIVKYQPNNLGFFWMEGLRVALLGLKDLYVNSIRDGWTVSKATFLHFDNLLKVGKNYKEVLEILKKIEDFQLIITGIVAANASLEIQEKTEKCLAALDNFKQNLTLSIDDIKAIADYLDTVAKVLATSNSNIAVAKNLSDILSSVEELEVYREFKNGILSEGLEDDIRVQLLTPKELFFIESYYSIKKLKIVISIIDLFAELLRNEVSALDSSDIIKSIGIAYKFFVGLPGIEPTFNQNFASYVTRSAAIYKQDIGTIVDIYNSLRHKMRYLVDKYANGKEMTEDEIKEMVLLWKKYNVSDEFSNYIVSRYLKKNKKIVLEKMIFTNVKDGAAINLPHIGTLYNTTAAELKNIRLQIWGKKGNIVDTKLSLSDVAIGGENGLNVVEIGDMPSGITIEFSKEDAFYDKEGDFYYYKYGLFDENKKMIYAFIEQKGGGYVPGWDYTKTNNVIDIDSETGDISIEGAFGVIPFYVNEREYIERKRFERFVDFTGVNEDNSLIQYAIGINKYNKERLSEWVERIFSVDAAYAKNRLLNEEIYSVKDILYIQLKILDYVYKNSTNETYRQQSEKVLKFLNRVLSKKRLVEKYGKEKILYKVLKRYGITSINEKDFEDVLTYGVFKKQLFLLYKFLRGAKK